VSDLRHFVFHFLNYLFALAYNRRQAGSKLLFLIEAGFGLYSNGAALIGILITKALTTIVFIVWV
jgi:hypothetical protein